MVLPARRVARALASLAGPTCSVPSRNHWCVTYRRMKDDEPRGWRPSGVAAADFLFSTIPNMNCLRADLALAGIPDQDEAGRYVDFHSLR